jgi:hypothetical protein
MAVRAVNAVRIMISGRCHKPGDLLRPPQAANDKIRVLVPCCAVIKGPRSHLVFAHLHLVQVQLEGCSWPDGAPGRARNEGVEPWVLGHDSPHKLGAPLLPSGRHTTLSTTTTINKRCLLTTCEIQMLKDPCEGPGSEVDDRG